MILISNRNREKTGNSKSEKAGKAALFKLSFSNEALRRLIVPLFFEQLLVMLVGMADVFVVSYAGEAAVSGVSLVNSFNTIFINLFTALSSGGAVVISQYIGRGDSGRASGAASQLLTACVLFSAAVTVIILSVNAPLMRLCFGEVEPEVMAACVTYLRISAYSYPALAVYGAGAALYRSVGKTSVTMYISAAANVINVAGNCLGVFYFHAGVAGVAWPSLISRAFSAVMITALCFARRGGIRYTARRIFCLDGYAQRTILRIAVPNGVESGVFQLVKVALSSVAALFGTYQIAANGVAQTLWNLSALVCAAMGPVFITVIGQCMGADDIPAAEFYFKKLTKITLILAVCWNALVFAATPLMLHFYALADETKRLTLLLVLIHNVFNAFVYPFADPLGKGLRAAGDVRFTMTVSLITSIGVRLISALLLGVALRLGVISIAWAMVLDWSTRAVVFALRFRRGRWKSCRVI